MDPNPNAQCDFTRHSRSSRSLESHQAAQLRGSGYRGGHYAGSDDWRQCSAVVLFSSGAPCLSAMMLFYGAERNGFNRLRTQPCHHGTRRALRRR